MGVGGAGGYLDPPSRRLGDSRQKCRFRGSESLHAVPPPAPPRASLSPRFFESGRIRKGMGLSSAHSCPGPRRRSRLAAPRVPALGSAGARRAAWGPVAVVGSGIGAGGAGNFAVASGPGEVEGKHPVPGVFTLASCCALPEPRGGTGFPLLPRVQAHRGFCLAAMPCAKSGTRLAATAWLAL